MNRTKRVLRSISERTFGFLFECAKKLSGMTTSRDNGVGRAVEYGIGVIFLIPMWVALEMGRLAEVGHL